MQHGEMSFMENPDSAFRLGPQLNLPRGDIRKKQLPLDIPSLLQSLLLLSSLWRLSSLTAEGRWMEGGEALGALRQGGIRERGHSWGPLAVLPGPRDSGCQSEGTSEMT